MIKKLAKHGNSYALVIDRSIMDLLKIDPSTPLEITTDGRGLHVSPVRDEEHRRRIRAASAKSIERYGGMLKRLAR